MTPAGDIRCAIYLRVSTDRQVEGNSLTTQRSQLLCHADRRGCTVVDEYVDAGLSGKDTNRPELKRLLEDAGRGRFDLVLVWKVDRISRSMRDLLGLIETLRDHGVDFAAIDQQFDTSDPMGMLTLHVLGSFAQFERELIVERSKEGHLHRVRSREWSCGPAPYGYRKEEGKLIEIPEEAVAVRRIFDLYLELGTFRGVANRLNQDKAPARKGGSWSAGTVKQMLINPVYAGANVYGRHARGDTRLKPRDQWTVIPNMREPLVDPELFKKVQELVLTRRGAGTPQREPIEYSLSGLVRCGACGSAMAGSAIHKRKKTYRYYRCNGNLHRGAISCKGTKVRADVLEEHVAEVMRELMSKAQPSEKTVPAVEDAETRARRSELHSRLATIRRRIARLFDLYEQEYIDKEAFRERMTELECEKNVIAGKLAALPSIGEPTEPSSGTGAERMVDPGDSRPMASAVREVVVSGRSAEVVLGVPGYEGFRQRIACIERCDTSHPGGRLRQWRLERGLLQKQVAEMLGVGVQTIRDWEVGRSRPKGYNQSIVEALLAKKRVLPD